MPDVDIKVGEHVISRRLILSPSDPVFDPRFRPPLETVIPWILAYRGPWLIPYASVPFDHHRGVGEQNLFRCLFGRDSLIIADFLGARVPGLRRGVIAALGEAQGENFNSKSEEEPGRIPHEVRDAGDERAREIMETEGWSFPYYGSVDSTPLWLKALAKEALKNPVSSIFKSAIRPSLNARSSRQNGLLLGSKLHQGSSNQSDLIQKESRIKSGRILETLTSTQMEGSPERVLSLPLKLPQKYLMRLTAPHNCNCFVHILTGRLLVVN